MKKLKSQKKEWHAPKSQIGMGDYYGSGVKNPMGRVRDGMGMNDVPKKKMKTPPKSWA
ncbi:MAG TPA: hypothetical protein VK553_05635 [Candidatus Nitrosopolaris rasttigaisensis]|nr:hypothetical protein [Candidatus Nitrosopolaris rasttigaisensis]